MVEAQKYFPGKSDTQFSICKCLFKDSYSSFCKKISEKIADNINLIDELYLL
jgi:hypothetical protein